jgi:predicted Zn-dependent peptidase
VAQEVHHHTFDNGLTLLAECMGHVRSAAVYFMVPAGCVYDPPRQLGLATVLSELVVRGAGPRDSRELTLALDNLGLDRSESVGATHFYFGAGTLASNLPPALELYADILRRPHLPAGELDAVKALALQDLQGLEDEPRSRVLIELRRRHFPPPLGRDRHGTAEGIARLTAEGLRAHHRRYFQPRGTIISVAGNVAWRPLRQQVGRLFGDWEPGPEPDVRLGKARRGRRHIRKETGQTQIAVAYPSVPFGHKDYYAAQGAVQVLSGGMSSRLFTEVREKRGLCYAVWAHYQTFKDRAAVLAYADTQNAQAPQTLAVLLGELRRLREGVTGEEVERVRAGLKSSLVMQQESTSARARALASDWYYLGRVRSLDEIQEAIDSLTPRRIVEHVRRYPPKDITLVTLGPRPVRLGPAFRNGSMKPQRKAV